MPPKSCLKKGKNTALLSKVSTYANDFLGKLYHQEKAANNESQPSYIKSKYQTEFKATSTPVGSSSLEDIVVENICSADKMGKKPPIAHISRPVLREITNKTNNVAFANQNAYVSMSAASEAALRAKRVPLSRVRKDAISKGKPLNPTETQISMHKPKAKLPDLQLKPINTQKVSSKVRLKQQDKEEYNTEMDSLIIRLQLHENTKQSQVSIENVSITSEKMSAIKEPITSTNKALEITTNTNTRKRTRKSSTESGSTNVSSTVGAERRTSSETTNVLTNSYSLIPFNHSKRPKKLTYTQLLGLCCQGRDPLSLVRFKQAAN